MVHMNDGLFSLVKKKRASLPSWHDVTFARDIKLIAIRIAQANDSLEKFDSKSISSYKTLVSYKQKIEQTTKRLDAVATYLTTSLHPSAESDLEKLEEKRQELSTALSIANNKLEVFELRRKLFDEQRMKALQDLLQLFSNNSLGVSATEPIDLSIDDNMLHPEDLDQYAEVSFQLEAAVAKAELKVAESSKALEQELIAEEKELKRLKAEWVEARAVKERLETISDSLIARDQLEIMTREVNNLAVELALRGMPICGDEWFGETVGSSYITWSTFSVEQSSTGIEGRERESVGGGTASNAEPEPRVRRGLFDMVTGIEPPSCRRKDDDETPITNAQFRDMLQRKIKPMVETWQGAILTSCGAQVREQDSDQDQTQSSSISAIDDCTNCNVESLDDTHMNNDTSAVVTRPAANDVTSIETLTEPAFNDSISRGGRFGNLTRHECRLRGYRREAWQIQLVRDRKEVMRLLKEASPWIDTSGLEEGGQPDARALKILSIKAGRGSDCREDVESKQENQIFGEEGEKSDPLGCEIANHQTRKTSSGEISQDSGYYSSEMSKKQGDAKVKKDRLPLGSICDV